MITKPTVLILGAGASCPYGFPTGLQLKARICISLNSPSSRYVLNGESRRIPFYKYMVDNCANEHLVKGFVQDLVLSPDASIDTFLEHHSEYIELGHKSIANILLSYEKRSSLFDDWIYKWDDPKNNEKHWYQLLFTKLSSTFDEFENNQLAIITFNYDRSLEYYLLQAIRAKYKDANESQAGKKLRSIPIVHLYGKLGALEHCDTEGPFVPYGDERVFQSSINVASKGIHTINEEYAADQPAFVEARKLIKAAQRIYFLGFGYHEENMKRLFTDHDSQKPYNILKGTGSADDTRKGPHCYGTALGVSPHQLNSLLAVGLEKMRSDNSMRYRQPDHPRFFPDATIYDFLYHNPYSTLD